MSERVSPLDDRYYDEVKQFGSIFSEKSLFYYRLYVEALYLKKLCESGILKEGCAGYEPSLVLESLGEGWYEKVKELEKSSGHDVKAVELFLRQKLHQMGFKSLAPFVHLGLTSEDVNSNAYGIMLEKGKRELLRCYLKLALKISEMAKEHSKSVILGRTHGVVAVPTTFGKEMSYFSERIVEASERMLSVKPYGKLSGAVGSYNSFYFIDEGFDWIKFAKDFVEGLGLSFALVTKQNPLWDNAARILFEVSLINSIMRELAQDLWLYNSLGLIRFVRKGVGSSTMPHKVNPVDLEDAEGQCEVSNSLLHALIYEPLSSRMQRDLSDSTVRRNLGVAMAHSYLACSRLLRALNSFEFVGEEVNSHQEVLSEPLQIAFKLSGDMLAYERVFENIDKMKELAEELPEGLKEKFASLKPAEYVGASERIALMSSDDVEEKAKELLEKLEVK